MVITFSEKRKKMGYLVPVLIVAILVIAIILWQGFFGGVKTVPPPYIPPPALKVMINFEILEHPFLEKLQPFEMIPAFEEEIGRQNPFVPN